VTSKKTLRESPFDSAQGDWCLNQQNADKIKTRINGMFGFRNIVNAKIIVKRQIAV
jgi:hypothetical protein